MKVAVISGASSGIGLATAQKFIEQNYTVYNLDIMQPEFAHPQFIFLKCDLRNVAEIKAVVAQISIDAKAIDSLIVNAGVHFSQNFLDVSEADFDRVFEINFKAAFFLTQFVLPIMLKAKYGNIVFIGSDQSIIAKKNSAIYGSTKSALVNLTKSIAIDFSAQGICSNLIAAGSIDTPLYRQAIKKYSEMTGIDLNHIHEEEQKTQPIARIGQSDEVANFIYFLCSGQARFITGAVLPIDGGYTAV